MSPEHECPGLQTGVGVARVKLAPEFVPASARRAGRTAQRGGPVLVLLCLALPLTAGPRVLGAVSGDDSNHRVARVLTMMFRPPREPGQRAVCPQTFNALTPEEMRLCVRSLAAIFWQNKCQEYGRHPAFVLRLLYGTGTDAGTDELIRVMLYHKDMEVVQYLMTILALSPPGLELYPALSKFLERGDLSAEVRAEASALRALCVEPIYAAESLEVTRAVVKELAGRTDRDTILAIHAKHWQRLIERQAKMADAMADDWRTMTAALRRERRLRGKFYPDRPGPPGQDVRAVLALVKKQLPRGRARQEGKRPTREGQPRPATGSSQQ